MIVYLSNCWAS